MNLLTAQVVEKYFKEYIGDPEFPIVTYPGFYKYLINVKKFDKVLIKDLKLCFTEDIDLLRWIKAYCEGELVEKSLLGTAHATMSQFILRNKHGYNDSDSSDTNNTGTTIVNLVLDKHDS